MANYIDLTGKRFERLTVLEYAGYRGGAMWRCVCDCGNEAIVRSDHLRYGKIKSCGCYKRDVTAKEHGEKIKKHGMWNTRIYSIWRGMKQRCGPSASPDNIDCYYNKGIRVCKEWAESFEAFKDWAFKNGYKDTLSIDRLNENGNYEPSNCRWADAKQQNNNRGSYNALVSFNGARQTVSQWASELGINRQTLHSRLRRGWSAEKALGFGR
jgi:hypothetical protein